MYISYKFQFPIVAGLICGNHLRPRNLLSFLWEAKQRKTITICLNNLLSLSNTSSLRQIVFCPKSIIHVNSLMLLLHLRCKSEGKQFFLSFWKLVYLVMLLRQLLMESFTRSDGCNWILRFVFSALPTVYSHLHAKKESNLTFCGSLWRLITYSRHHRCIPNDKINIQ